MKVTLGELKQVIREEVNRLMMEGDKSEMMLSQAKLAEIKAEAPEPPELWDEFFNNAKMALESGVRPSAREIGNEVFNTHGHSGPSGPPWLEDASALLKVMASEVYTEPGSAYGVSVGRDSSGTLYGGPSPWVGSRVRR